MSLPFEGVLGNNCELRLLSFFLPMKDVQFNISQIADESGVNRVTTGNVVKKFVKWGILNSHEGGIRTYSLNPDSLLVRKIEDFDNALIEMILGQEKMTEIHDYISEKKQMKENLKPNEVSAVMASHSVK